VLPTSCCSVTNQPAVCCCCYRWSQASKDSEAGHLALLPLGAWSYVVLQGSNIYAEAGVVAPEAGSSARVSLLDYKEGKLQQAALGTEQRS
jgi:hypothetical protein